MNLKDCYKVIKKQFQIREFISNHCLKTLTLLKSDMWLKINSQESWNSLISYLKMINNSTCYLKSTWIVEISIKSIITSLFKTLISTMKMQKLSQKHMLILLLILKENQKSTKLPLEMMFLKTLRIFLEESEEKSRNKESELQSLWKISINWDMVISPKINLDFQWLWLKSHFLKPNSH